VNAFCDMQHIDWCTPTEVGFGFAAVCLGLAVLPLIPLLVIEIVRTFRERG
jgi:hypothetical protein